MRNEELAKLIQAGERDKVLELWQQVRRFAWRQARRWSAVTGEDTEDLLQTAFIALLDALEVWNHERGQFLTWYGLRLKSEFTEATGQRTQRDRLDPLQNYLSLDTQLTDQEGGVLLLSDVIPDPRAAAEMEAVVEHDAAARRNEAIRQALDALPADQRRAVVLRYWRGQNVDAKAHTKAMRALRRPDVSRGLRQYMTHT